MTDDRYGKSQKVDVLATLPLFEACTRREMDQIADISLEARKPAAAVLTREGQAGGIAFVILAGTAEVRRGEHFLGTLGPGDMVGELSLIDGRPRSATVTAVSDLHVLEINSDDFGALLDKAPHFTRNLLRSLSLRIRHMDERWRVEL